MLANCLSMYLSKHLESYIPIRSSETTLDIIDSSKTLSRAHAHSEIGKTFGHEKSQFLLKHLAFVEIEESRANEKDNEIRANECRQNSKITPSFAE